MPQAENDLLFAKLNLETAIIPWRELQRFFAQGKVLLVNREQDLVSTAQLIAANQQDPVQQLIESGCIQLVSDQQARTWIENDVEIWAVVVAPWVLVQEVKEDD